MKTLHSASDAQEASLLVVELRAHGIEAQAAPDARAMAYGTLPNTGYVQVQVPAVPGATAGTSMGAVPRAPGDVP